MNTNGIPDVTDKKECSEISVEDFRFFYKKAFDRDNLDAIKQLCDKYPQTALLALDEEYIDKINPQSDEEFRCECPIILSDNRMTERHVMNIVSYLLGLCKAPKQYKDYLKDVSFHEIFNYFTDRYEKDYDKNSLWNDFFMKQPELKRVIEHRHIYDIEELIYHAYEYFEKIYQNEMPL